MSSAYNEYTTEFALKMPFKKGIFGAALLPHQTTISLTIHLQTRYFSVQCSLSLLEGRMCIHIPVYVKTYTVHSED